MLKIFWALSLMLVSLQSLHAEEEVVKKVVYDLTTGDLRRFEQRLLSGIVAHKTYYQSQLQELEVRVIVHGDAYKFFMQDLHATPYLHQHALVAQQAALGKRLRTLATQYGVRFLVCEVGVKKRKLRPKAFYPFVSFVHNAAVGLIDAQNAGYAYLPLR